MKELRPGKETRFTIELAPVTKKNSQKIIWHKPTGRPMIVPSDVYKTYEHSAAWFMPHNPTIKEPVNVRALFYMPTKRRVDLVNLEEALLDVLVHYGVLDDDNSTIVAGMDGSRVLYDKENPRTEVIIEFLEEERK